MNNNNNDDSDDDKPKPKPSKTKTTKSAKNTPRNSSIITEGETLHTVAGDINGWKPCSENLPNHPTM